MSLEVKCVCVGCNTGWMSRLEDEARPVLLPLIEGRAADLTAPQRLTVATWSVKTAMVFDCTRAGRRLFFSQEERDRLFAARGGGGLGLPFPPNTFVWLAAYDGADPVTYAASELVGFDIRGHVATVSAGRFVSQVLSARLPPEATGREPVLHPAEAKWDRATVAIWPLRSGYVCWPPELRLDDGEMSLHDFALRWPRQSTKKRRSSG